MKAIKGAKKLLLGSAIIFLVAFIVIWNASSKRSTIGRIVRWCKGENAIEQYVSDFSEDIRTKPSLVQLQPWAMETLARYQKGQLKTNGGHFWHVEKSVTLALNETPKFISDQWGVTYKRSGWVLPEISIVLSNETPVCVVVDFYNYGVAVGPGNYQLSFDANVTNRVLPGIYTYGFVE